MTEKGGECWLQTIYYPFMYFAKYARGYVLNTKYAGATYDCEEFKDVPTVDHVVVLNEQENELVLFCINRDEKEEVKIASDFTGFEISDVIEAVTLTAEHKHMTNLTDHNAVIPKEFKDVKILDHNVEVVVKPLSFNVIRIRLRK